jgi:transcriptional regulator with XRE-family HTH domain
MVGIGERLKEIRFVLRLRQGEFADKMGISQGALSDFERETKPMAERYVKLICLTFGVNETWLRTGKGEMFLPPPPEPPASVIIDGRTLEPDEQELLDIYDQLITDTKKEIRDYVQEKLELQELRAVRDKGEEEQPTG